MQRGQATALRRAYAKRQRFGQLPGPARALALRPWAVVAFDEADQLYAVVFMQQYFGVAQVLPVQFHAHGQRIAEQMLAELRRHAVALLQQADLCVWRACVCLRRGSSKQGGNGNRQPQRNRLRR